MPPKRLLACACLLLALIGQSISAAELFTIEVVDQETGRGVPLIELRTVNDIRYFTDSNGIVALNEPGLMNQPVFFYVGGHGYTFPKNRFGHQGKSLQVTPGGHVQVKVQRVNLAERLYRVTGAGIYRDSLLVGNDAPIDRPLLNSRVFGCDSVLNAIYHDKIYWLWGDTDRPAHPLGNFWVSGATSELPSRGGLAPEVGVNLDYFVASSGFAKKMAPLPSQGPVWLSGLTVLTDPSGEERMFACYVKIFGGDRPLDIAEQGLVEYDDEKEEFVHVTTFPMDGPFPHGAHALLHTTDGVPYVYYCDPFPMIRVEAKPEALADLTRYEAFTCLAAGTRLKDRRLDRDASGVLRCAWKADTDRISPREEPNLVRKGLLAEEDRRWILRDVETDKPVMAHRGTVAWNAYRQRWIMVLNELGGTSNLGEIWYTEADDLLGPWTGARKIVTHDRYSLYNVNHHAFFDRQQGRVIFFEGTYTTTFSGNTDETPRYNYNQIMYRLDLSRVVD